MARKDSPQSAVPEKAGRIAQMRQIFTTARAVDPAIGWWMLLALLGVTLVGVVVGLVVGHPIYAGFLGLMFGVLAAMVVMSRRAERAAYRSIEGQPGAAGAALSALRRGWYYDQQPVAAEAVRPGDLTSAAMVFRATGRPGVVLVGEGPSSRASRLLESERKKVARILPGVPVTVLRIGDGDSEGEVSVRKLAGKVQKLKPVLTKEEAAQVNKRLKALGGARPPIPAGVDPNRVRMDRKAMRGR